MTLTDSGNPPDDPAADSRRKASIPDLDPDALPSANVNKYLRLTYKVLHSRGLNNLFPLIALRALRS